MHIYRFYLPEENSVYKDEIVLGKEERNKIKNVLRLNVQDRIILFNKKGEEFLAEISHLDKLSVKCRILKLLSNIEEPKVQITLAQSFLKSDKIDLVISKATEIGVRKIILFKSERSVVKISSDRKENKLKRYYKIAKSSSQQSRRGIVPEICLSEFLELIKSARNYSLSLIFHENSKTSLKKILSKNKNVNNILIIIGPEGGFTEGEVREAEKYNIHSISLGRRILKSETSAIVATSLILYEYGEI